MYFELVANQLAVLTALEFGVFGTLSRTTFDRLLPEIATYLRIEDLQSVTLAYLAHAGYDQAARDGEVPAEVRRLALTKIHEAHRAAIGLVQARAFDRAELRRLDLQASPDERRLLTAAQRSTRLRPREE